jgi:hypothetical protein
MACPENLDLHTLPSSLQVIVAKVNPLMETLAGAECRCSTCGGRLGERFLDGQSFPGTPAMRSGRRFSVTDHVPLSFLARELAQDLPKWR